jgi:hypothetical protein
MAFTLKINGTAHEVDVDGDIPLRTCSSLHRYLQRHGIGRLSDVDGDKPMEWKFECCPVDFFHIDIAEVRTEQSKLRRPSPSTAPRGSPSPNCTSRPPPPS